MALGILHQPLLRHLHPACLHLTHPLQPASARGIVQGQSHVVRLCWGRLQRWVPRHIHGGNQFWWRFVQLDEPDSDHPLRHQRHPILWLCPSAGLLHLCQGREPAVPGPSPAQQRSRLALYPHCLWRDHGVRQCLLRAPLLSIHQGRLGHPDCAANPAAGIPPYLWDALQWIPHVQAWILQALVRVWLSRGSRRRCSHE